MFAKAGAVVVTYDMIGEGERNDEKKSQANAHDKWWCLRRVSGGRRTGGSGWRG